MNANMNGHDYELLTTIGADFKQLCFVGTVARTHNKGLKEMAGDVVNQTVVQEIFKRINNQA